MALVWCDCGGVLAAASHILFLTLCLRNNYDSGFCRASFSRDIISAWVCWQWERRHDNPCVCTTSDGEIIVPIQTSPGLWNGYDNLRFIELECDWLIKVSINLILYSIKNLSTVPVRIIKYNHSIQTVACSNPCATSRIARVFLRLLVLCSLISQV
jgi:hypothetical protein